MDDSSPNEFSLPLKIAISRGDLQGSYPMYQQWINACEHGVELINLYGMSSKDAEFQLMKCSGLLLSGGNDIHPYHYNKSEKADKCISIDDQRDTLEFLVILKALSLNLPILGICRGMQMLNVVLGGNLITDIPSEVATDILHHREGDQKDNCFHEINILPNSLISAIVNQKTAFVNSYHHQSIDCISGILTVSATSPDGIIEAIEWKNPEERPFLLGVQWHPERMNNYDIFSLSIAVAFIDAARAYKGRV